MLVITDPAFAIALRTSSYERSLARVRPLPLPQHKLLAAAPPAELVNAIGVIRYATLYCKL